MAGIRALMLAAVLAAETGTGGPSAPAPQRPTSGTAPTTDKAFAKVEQAARSAEPGNPAPKPRTTPTGETKPAETKPAEPTPSPAASVASGPTPASPAAPAAEAEAEAPKRRGRPPGSGTGTTAPRAEPRPATPPNEMGMGQLLKAANAAAAKVKDANAKAQEAADALAVLTDEMNKRLA